MHIQSKDRAAELHQWRTIVLVTREERRQAKAMDPYFRLAWESSKKFSKYRTPYMKGKMSPMPQPPFKSGLQSNLWSEFYWSCLVLLIISWQQPGSEIHGCLRQFLAVVEGHKRSPLQIQIMSQALPWEAPRCNRSPSMAWIWREWSLPLRCRKSRQLKPLGNHPLTSCSAFSLTWTHNKTNIHTHFLTGIFPSALSCIFSFTRLWKNTRLWKCTCTILEVLFSKEKEKIRNWENYLTGKWKSYQSYRPSA